MKKTILAACWLGAAVLLAASGVGYLLGVGGDGTEHAVWIGVAMAAAGLMEMGQVWLMRRGVFGDRSFYTKAVVCVITGVFMLGQEFIAGEVLRVLVSMMTMVNGVSLLGAAWAMHAARVKGRAWLWLIGVAELALGCWGFLKPAYMLVAPGALMGVSLLAEGLTLVYTWTLGMRHVEEKTA